MYSWRARFPIMDVQTSSIAQPTNRGTSKMTSKPVKPALYNNIVPITAEHHGEMYLDRVDNFSYTRDLGFVYVFCMEFIRAAKEYPIVFSVAGDEVFPVAMLGLRRDQNVFLDDNGNWLVDYIPAYIRRYPYMLAEDQQNKGKYVVCIDDTFAGLNKEGRGERLYNDDGTDGPGIAHAKEFLVTFQKNINITSAFCKRLQELDLLVPMPLPTGAKRKRVDLEGFAVVDRNRIFDLEDAKLVELIRNDDLELIYMHMFSANLLTYFYKKYV